MSNLLEQASLVMIPSGYKEDIVYSVIPTSGAGDLTFTRASNGTRIDSNGNVELVPWNLVENSENFSTTWNLVGLTLGTNATTAPNGTITADSFTSATSTANHVIYQLLTGVSGAYTFSVYVKKANSRYVYIKLVGNASDWVAAVFDLNDGTLTKSEASGWTGLSASSESVGNGWYRLIVSGSGATSANFNVGIQYTNTGTPTFSAYADAAFTGTGTIDYYIWGAQINTGALKPYFPTTDRLNVPRLTYQNGGGGCPSLLLEKQSTNLLIYSEQFDQWATNGTTTSNVAISPDGTQNADRLNYTSGSVYWLDNAVNVTNGVAYTFTLYVKPTSVGDQFRFYIDGGFNASQTITTDSSDWKRYEWTFTATATTSINPHILLGYGMTSQSILAWGAQLEASSYATSYIPTTSSSATRVADACYKTGISSLIGASEGTVFVDYVWLNNKTDVIPFEIQGSNGKLIWFRGIGVQFYGDSTTLLADLGVMGGTYGERYKLAFVYGQNDFRLYKNGSLVGSVTSGTFSSGFSNVAFNVILTESMKYNELVIFPNKLTNSELAQITGNQNYTINQAYESYGVASESPNCVQP